MLSVRIDPRRGLNGIAMGLVSLALAAADTGPAERAGAYRSVIGEGILARTLDVSRVPDAGLEVEIWQMLVAAHAAEVGGAALPGGAILELLSGRGSIRINGKARDVEPGAILALDQDAKILFDNSKGEVPLEWRITLVRVLTR